MHRTPHPTPLDPGTQCVTPHVLITHREEALVTTCCPVSITTWALSATATRVPADYARHTLVPPTLLRDPQSQTYKYVPPRNHIHGGTSSIEAMRARCMRVRDRTDTSDIVTS